MVLASLNQVADPVGGGVFERRTTTFCLDTIAGAPVGEGAVEAQHCVSGSGGLIGELQDFVTRHVQSEEYRIGQKFRQFGL